MRGPPRAEENRRQPYARNTADNARVCQSAQEHANTLATLSDYTQPLESYSRKSGKIDAAHAQNVSVELQVKQAALERCPCLHSYIHKYIHTYIRTCYPKTQGLSLTNVMTLCIYAYANIYTYLIHTYKHAHNTLKHIRIS